MSGTTPNMAQAFRLDDQIALVTGAGAGIGRAAALALAQAGAKVAVTDINATSAQQCAADIVDAGGQATAWTLDVAQEESICTTAVAVAQAFGPVDILVNNAGVAHREPAEEMTTRTWARVMAINVDGAFICSREFGRDMLRRRRGCIVNVISIMGLVGGGLYPNLAYHTSKGALVNMTRALAAEWGDRGVRVNAIAPTYVNTDLTANLRADARMVRQIEERTPLGRFAEPQDMAGGILYLASPAAAMVTGHILAIDGGWLAI
ncbi:MAG: SDR family NAD(P)-dependent oxidoreductase [Alphaproteobacteria bacterium]